MLTDAEYRKLAKIILYKNCIRDVANSIYNDPIKFGRIVESIMIADWKWNGIGNIYGYRKQMVKWCIKNILKENKRNINRASTIEDLTNTDAYTSLQYYEKDTNSIGQIEEEDYNAYIREKISNSKILTESEKKILTYKILENKTMKEISQNIGISVQGAKQTFKRGISKIGESLCAY